MRPMRSMRPIFDDPNVRELIRLAMREDLGSGDVTSEACIPRGTPVRARIVAREPGIVAGLPLVPPVLGAFGARAKVTLKVRDGAAVKAGRTLAMIEGPARGILASERTILNFLQRLSGVATLTRRYVDAVAGTRARIYDTRKTTPGWRALEKYAVRVGGGTNHRMGLYDEGLVKDNHVVALRSQGLTLKDALHRLRAARSASGLFVEIEADDERGVREAVAAGADAVLLDNMTPVRMAKIVRQVRAMPDGKRVALEASGGVTLKTVRAVARTGVDRISIGALTHSARALDIAMDFE